jgi:hypothetical protein
MNFVLKAQGHFPEIGGVWSVCSVNDEREIAAGTMSGIIIV